MKIAARQTQIDRKKKLLALGMVVMTLFSSVSMFTGQTEAELDETPLQGAEKAAVWVMNEAIPEAGGYKWGMYTCHGTLFYKTDSTYGAAGIGTFLLLLHERTGNSTYLDYAEGAAQWVINQAIPSHGGYLWLSPDDDVPSGWRISCDVAEIGKFFLKMYRATGNLTYLDYAKGAAQWMMAMAEYEYGGCFIPYNPPGKYGSQAAHGIGPGRESYTMSLLLHLYQETGNTTYLPYIKGMAQWLTAALYCKAENGGYKWLWGYPYESHYSVNTAARIVRYFYETYQALGNETYLHYANGGVQWILSQAVVDNDKVKWPSRQGASDYPLIIGDKLLHGIAVASDILLMGYSVTGNTTYLEYAKKHTDWILSQAVPEGDGYRFDNAWYTAEIYRYLRDAFNLVRNVTYSQYADGALIWIINNATITDGGYKWRTLSIHPYCPVWFAGGAAGIGYYLSASAEIPNHAKLIKKYFPHLIFDEEEECFPTNFYYDDQNIDNNPSNYDKNTWPLSAYIHVAEGRWYDWGSWSGGEKDYLVIQYWFYYAKDNKFWDIPLLGAHDHDWESIFIFLEKKNPEPEPKYVIFFHHYGGLWFIGDRQDSYDRVSWETPFCSICDVEKVNGTHPIVHVARHSHASYPWTTIGMSKPLQKVMVPIPTPELPGWNIIELPYTEPCDGGRELDYDDFQTITVEEPNPGWPTTFGEIPAPWAKERRRWDDPGYLLRVVVKLSMSIVANSPVNLLVTSPNGLRTGYDPQNESVVNEIVYAIYSGEGSEPQVINIPDPLPGNYTIDVFGTEMGNYTITIENTATNGTVIGMLTLNGTTSRGKLDTYSIQLNEDYTVVPEFPIFLILPILMILSLIAAVFTRKRHFKDYS